MLGLIEQSWRRFEGKAAPVYVSKPEPRERLVREVKRCAQWRAFP